jgi:hypothetical protein
MSGRTLGPFPVLPITTRIVNGMIRPGWFPAACPICRDRAATCYRSDALQSRYVCPTCQRFTLTSPAHSTLDTWHRHPIPGSDARLAGLSLWSARAIEPVTIDLTTVWQLAESGRRLLGASEDRP